MEPLRDLLLVAAPNVSTAHRKSPQPFSHIRLFFAYTRRMKVTGYDRKIDWPKLGPSLLIATALIVAIRTAKWAAKGAGDAKLSDVDVDLDREVSYAVRISVRVMHELLRRHTSLFPQKLDPTFEAGSDDDSPK
jgi:hypothetical protein